MGILCKRTETTVARSNLSTYYRINNSFVSALKKANSKYTVNGTRHAYYMFYIMNVQAHAKLDYIASSL